MSLPECPSGAPVSSADDAVAPASEPQGGQGATDSPLPAAPTKRRYAGASAQERQAQRRERLLEAAFDVFGAEGYSNATMRLVCARARLTERYFYENFDSMFALFVAVHRRVSAQAAKVIEARRAEVVDDTDPLNKSRASVRGFLEFIKEDPRRARILLTDAVTTGLASVRNVNARVADFIPYLRDRIRTYFPHLQIDVDVEMVASGLIGLLIHTATLWAQNGFQTPVDKVLDHIMFAWRGLGLWLAENNRPPAAPASAQAD